MSATKVSGGELWITRMRVDGNDSEVARICYAEGGAAATLAHMRRVFPTAEQGADHLTTGDLIVTLLDADGDSTDEDPFRVPAAQADWFLNEWLRVPKSWRATPAAPQGAEGEG